MRSKFLLTSALAVLLLNAWGDIESTNNIGYTTGADGTQQLVNVVYYNSFDSAEQVAHPAFGPTSICWNVELRDGKKGQALYVPANTPTIGIPFTQGLPQEKGCIEFWAKVLPTTTSFYDSGNPRFFMFNPKNKPEKTESAFSWLELNGNNGCGQSGWIFAFFSVFKTSHTWGSGSSYPEVFGDLDYRDWHHYVIKWNVNGLSDDATTAIRFSIDNETKISFSTSEVDPNLLKSYLSQSFEMYWPRPDADPIGFQKNKVPFLLDELTIWDSDATESTPPSPPQPAAGSLVYYSTLDSATAVTQPEAGVAGTCEGATFVQGVKGQALYVQAGAKSAICVPFENGLPQEKGCLEFWARIDPTSGLFATRGNPRFFSFNRIGYSNYVQSEIEFNSNNGNGGSGITMVLGHITLASNTGNAYARVLGDSGVRDWHHYVMRWNVDGLLNDAESVARLEIDDAVICKMAKKGFDVEYFKLGMSFSYELYFPIQENYAYFNQVSYAIDEFKVWDSDVTENSNVNPTPGPVEGDGVDVVDGVTWYYTLKDGKATIVPGTIAYAGDLVVPTTVDGYPVVALAENCFRLATGVTSVVVPEGVVSVGIAAFALNPNLVRVVLPESATNLLESGFYDCSRLVDCSLPSQIDRLYPYFFHGTAVTNVVIPDTVKTIDHDVFWECRNLESVHLPEALTFMDWSAFQKCSALKSVEFPAGFQAFGAYSYDELHAAFGYCTSLESAIFKGPVPQNFAYSWLDKLGCKIYYPKAYASQWAAVVPATSFGGYTEDLGGGTTDPIVDPDPGAPGRLVYHTTFDSAVAVTQPEAGVAGTCEGATFGEGKAGQALYVSAGTTVAKIPLPQGLPVEKGAIEFWAKIDTANTSFTSGGNPLFFSFNRTKPDINGNLGTSVTFLEINSNNGWGGSGFSFVLGDIFSSPGVGGWSNAYASLFGESGDQTWHHYELKWNIAGLAEDSQSVCLLKVDGAVKTKTALEKLKVASFKEAMDYPCELTFSYRPNDYSRVPFWIDEFKIWDSDVVGSVVDPTDDPTDDPVVEGLVLSNIAKSYPAGLEIEPIAVTYTGAAEKAKVSVSGLPQGLVFKNGVIAGTPELPGESTVVVTVKSGSATVATRTVTIRVSNYVDDLVSGLADAYGPFVPGEPLDLDLAPVAGWKAAHALPSGLSFSATTGRLTGTPKKPGVYPLVFTRKVGFALRAVSTLVTIAPLRQVKVEAEGEGTVKGAGAYLAHARVTLTAKAAKGYAVLGWYRGEERVSRDASFAYTVGTEAEQTLVAKFVTQEADRASIDVAFGETALDPVEALVVTNYQGVAVSWPLACDALTKPTVSVSGLPSGLSFKDGLLKGASTTASTRDKAGTYKPKTAKVTVKTLGGTTAKYAIDFVTLPRPVWAAGSYDGVYSLEDEVAGRVTLTLNPNGKASGKIWTTVDGAAVTATLTAPMITAYDADSDTFRIEATCAVKKQPDQTIVFTLAAREADGVGTLEAAGEGDAFTLVQNIWKEKSYDAPAFPSGKKALSLTLPEGLTLKFGAKGVVTCAGKLDGENGAKVSVSGSAQFVLDAEGQGAVLIYLAPKKNFGGFIQCVPLACEVVDGEVTQVGLR